MMSYSHILLNAWPFTPIDGQCKTSTPFHKKLMLSTLWLVVWSWSNFYFICFKVGYAEHSEMQADKKCPCEFRICKTHVCKQINVLLGPTLYVSKSCSKEEKMNIFLKKKVYFSGWDILTLAELSQAYLIGVETEFIRFKCNLFSVSEYVVCASGHPSSIQDHENPMIIQGEYKVHLLNDIMRRNACLPCLSLICENLFLHFSLYLYLLPFPAVITVIVGHPYFSKFFVSIAVKAVIVGHLFATQSRCFDKLEFICKTHVCKRINVLLGPTSFVSKSFSKKEKINYKTCIYFQLSLAKICDN